MNLQVRNNANETKTIPTHSDVSLRDADDIRQTQVTSANTELIEPVTNTYTPPTTFGGDAEVEPGTQVKGWVAYTLSDYKTDIRIELPDLLTQPEGTADDSGGETVAWDISVPEETGVVFEETIDMPTDPRSGAPSEITATVTNNGIRRGRVQRNYTVYGYRDKNNTKTIDGSIDGGSSETITVEFTPYKPGPHAFDSTRRDYDNFEVTARTFTFGDTWDSPSGLNVTLSDPVFADSVTYNSSEGDNLEATPTSGHKFLVFNYTSESDETHYWNPRFVASVGDEHASTNDGNRVTRLLDGYGEELTQPLSGSPVSLGSTSNWPNRNGPMVMEVPDSFTMSDLEIRIEETASGFSDEPTDQHAAVWTAE